MNDTTLVIEESRSLLNQALHSLIREPVAYNAHDTLIS